MIYPISEINNSFVTLPYSEIWKGKWNEGNKIIPFEDVIKGLDSADGVISGSGNLYV